MHKPYFILLLSLVTGMLLLSCKSDCRGIVVRTVRPGFGGPHLEIDPLLLFEDGKSNTKLYVAAQCSYDSIFTLIIKSKSDYLSLEKKDSGNFPLQIKSGTDSVVFIAQAGSVNKLSQFEESAVYQMPVGTMKTIIDVRNNHGGVFIIGRFNIDFTDELACGITKLMKAVKS